MSYLGQVPQAEQGCLVYDFQGIGTALGALVVKKNAAYGNSFEKAAIFLSLLYPKGVPVEAYQDMLLLVRIFDKQMRIATAKDAFGETPFADIAGYAIIGTAIDQEQRRMPPSDAGGVL